ncbi:MAG: PDZ domain-containing protein [Candidatus Aminicenantes bacterium]|nr:PDZ domain-containing protein [Candidatus Aminicenantes bacterium]
MTVNRSWSQDMEQTIWPQPSRRIWYWVDPQVNLIPDQINVAFKNAIDEEMAFLDPDYNSTVFLAKNIRFTKGKTGERKKHKDQPAKADDIRIEAEWRTGYLNQYRGSSFSFIPINSVRSLELRFWPDLRKHFPKVPEGRNWNVNMYAGSRYDFFFRTEDSARNFINALASALSQRGLSIPFSRFGLMWDNVTPAQAADSGMARAESVLITMVAIAGPADRAGISPLDIVLECNGSKVKNFSHFSLLLDSLSPGAHASLLLLRRLKDPNRYPDQNEWKTLTVQMEAR